MTTESAPAPAAAPVKKINKKIQRPDKATFEAELKKLEADLQAKIAISKQAQEAIKNFSASGVDNQKRDEIKATLSQLRQKQADIKSQKAKINNEISQVDERIQRRNKEFQAAKSKVNFRSVEELDNHVKDLEKKVDAGTFRIAEERKALNEISNLKKLRKNFGGIEELKSQIDADKQKISELKAQIRAFDSSAISAQYEKSQSELNAINDKSQDIRKSRDALYNRRNQAQKDVDATLKKLKGLKDEYYGQIRAYREQNAAEIAARKERERVEREEAEKERRREVAEEKLEIASEPAFASQIATAKNLLAYFDPTYTAASGSASTSFDELNKTSTRVVEAPAQFKVLKKETEVFFAGTGGKKNKKKASHQEPAKKDDKLTVNFQVVEDLTNLNIAVPTSNADVPKTIEDLKKKIDYYVANEERVTKERIEKAKAEIAKLEAEAEAEAAAEKAEETPKSDAE